MNARQFELERQIQDLEHRLAEAKHQQTQSIDIEFMWYEHQTQIDKLESALEQCRKELVTVADCEAFLVSYGREMHDLYKARYPINVSTKVQSTPMRGTIRYALPIEARVDIEPISPIATMQTRDATFTEWYIPNRGYVHLAFAPEINTVFVSTGYR